jgi:uncharacterized protein (TIGR03118 family)
MSLKITLLAASLLAATPALAGSYVQTNLVSNVANQAAVTDPNLQNPWGISYSPTGAFWVSDNADGLTTLYNGSGAIQHLVVTIPAAATSTGPGSPTGQVFYSGTGFTVTQNGKSGSPLFIFATEDGTISGWSPSVNSGTAVIAVDRSTTGLGAVYKGLALYTDATTSQTFLLATDFRNNEIDVFDSTYNLAASFRDSTLPPGYAPYNIAVLGGKIYVTYAVQDKSKHDSRNGPHLGAVEQIDITGKVLFKSVHRRLNAPWGLAIAPAGFGPFQNDLLVGNFGDGHITAFDAKLKPVGQLEIGGAPLAIPGLWGLIIGNGGSGGSASDIYFSAGPDNEQNGLFGSLSYTP